MFAGHGLGQFTLVQYVEPAVNRQPGFRRELVEQVSFSKIVLYVFFIFYIFSEIIKFERASRLFQNFLLT